MNHFVLMVLLLPFLGKAQATSTHFEVFQLSYPVHYIENPDAIDRSILIDFDSKGRYQLLLTSKAEQQKWVSFLKASKIEFSTWKADLTKSNAINDVIKLVTVRINDTLRFKKRRKIFSAAGPHLISSFAHSEGKNQVYFSIAFPWAYAEGRKRIRRKPFHFAFKSKEEIAQFIRAMTLLEDDAPSNKKIED